MREQARVLEHIAQRAPVSRHEAAGVLPGFAIHFEPARAALQSGDATQQRGLATTRLAEQGRDAASRQVEIDIQRKARVVQAELRFYAHRDFRPVSVYSASSTRKEKASMPPASQWAWPYSSASTWS